jgi:hypothetical protein
METSKSRNFREITPRSSFEGKCEVALVSQEALFQMTTENIPVDYWDLVEYYSNRSQAVFIHLHTIHLHKFIEEEAVIM